ncbi:MFS transporter [Streptomyces luteocolor]|uniref:MFS transporter n=1 Tax=Streptomyces luteocolor TaxID=285500 RepID=UPI0008536D8B|nr:MFS transporter [Streptomyces luteocolor]
MKDLAILKDRAVCALFLARLVSLLGNAIAPVAIAFAVLGTPGASASSLGLVLTGRLLAQVTFVLLGGLIADRLPKQRVMVGADLAAAAVQGVVAALVITSNASALGLAGLAALSGAAAALFEPASRSLMPQLVSGDALQSANALLKLSMRGGSIIGAALAGVLVALIGVGPTIAVDAATFLVSALLLMAIRVRLPAPPAAGPSLLVQIKEGWREFTARQWVWVIVAQLAFVNVLLAGAFYVLGPVVAKAHLGGATAWSAVLTAQAVGFVLGTVAAMKVRPRNPIRTAALLTVGFPLPLFLLAGHAPVYTIAVAAFLAAICIDIYEVTIDTALQKHVPPEALARVMSYESLGSFAFVPLGLAVAGPVADAVGTGPALTGAGLLIMLAGPIVVLLPSIRAVPALDPQADEAKQDVASA